MSLDELKRLREAKGTVTGRAKLSQPNTEDVPRPYDLHEPATKPPPLPSWLAKRFGKFIQQNVNLERRARKASGLTAKQWRKLKRHEKRKGRIDNA